MPRKLAEAGWTKTDLERAAKTYVSVAAPPDEGSLTVSRLEAGTSFHSPFLTPIAFWQLRHEARIMCVYLHVQFPP